MTTTRADCIRRAGEQLAEHDSINAAASPRELAEAAWHPNSRLTVEELEDSIRAERGLPPRHVKAS